MRLIVQLGLRNLPQVDAVGLTRQNGNGFHESSLVEKMLVRDFPSVAENEGKSVSDERICYHDHSQVDVCRALKTRQNRFSPPTHRDILIS
jgi:hypothetical protein